MGFSDGMCALQQQISLLCADTPSSLLESAPSVVLLLLDLQTDPSIEGDGHNSGVPGLKWL